MISPLAAIPLAVPFLSRLLGGGGASSAPAKTRPTESSFSSELLKQTKKTSPMGRLDQAAAMHNLIALQQGGSRLQPEIQASIGQQLLHRTVQLTDAGGNSVVGKVTDYSIVGGQAHLTVNGKLYPINSLQAVLHHHP